MLVQPTDNHKYTVSNITFYINIYIYYVLFLAWDNGGSFGNHCGIEKAVGAGSGAGSGSISPVTRHDRFMQTQHSCVGVV